METTDMLDMVARVVIMEALDMTAAVIAMLAAVSQVALDDT